MDTITNYHGHDMQITDDAQIVRGIVGNAVYFPFGSGLIPQDNNYNEVSFSLWRRWDGVADNDYRGVLKTANVNIYFDNVSDKLKIELTGLEPITLDDVKDEAGEFIHWVFVFVKNDVFKVYKNAELMFKTPIGDFVVDLKSEGVRYGGGRTHATFDEMRTDKAAFTPANVRYLYRFPGRNVQASDVQKIVSNTAPKYLGMVETVPTTRTAVITKGERLGAVDANPGDWVLMNKTIGGWKAGVCYKWLSGHWINLEPEVNYTEEYHSCLLHLFEIEEIANQTGRFGAVLCKRLVAQDALITSLTASMAFIEKLEASNFTTRKLKIDSVPGTNTDFEAFFDKDNGLLIKNDNKILFNITNTGEMVLRGANLTANKLIAPTLNEDPTDAVFGEIWFRRGV